jgi:ABC-type bacteriocin/lantibiotic exporter with double-glycine peptidase domain
MSGREGHRENRGGIGAALRAGSTKLARASRTPAMVFLGVLSILLASGAGADASEPVRLPVPYVTQPKALCGGAAAAMVFRYWGDGNADPNQFAPLLDPAGAGIATDVLAQAIEDRGWRVVRFIGSVESVHDLLRERRPVIVLLGEARGRFHYVVVVGTADDHIVVHDPARGPSRRMSLTAFVNRWQPAGFWALLVLPPRK